MSAQLEVEMVSAKSLRLALVKARLEGLRFDALAPVIARALHVPESRAWELIDGLADESLTEIARADSASIAAAIRTVVDGEPEPEPEVPVREWPFPCTAPGCGKGFDTKQGRSMHMTKVHGPKAEPTTAADPDPGPDPEVYAIGYAVPLLEPLPQAARRRVLDYLAQRFVVDSEQKVPTNGR
jgi:hypothetical protein